jgi:hypothetical protein
MISVTSRDDVVRAGQALGGARGSRVMRLLGCCCVGVGCGRVEAGAGAVLGAAGGAADDDDDSAAAAALVFVVVVGSLDDEPSSRGIAMGNLVVPGRASPTTAGAILECNFPQGGTCVLP